MHPLIKSFKEAFIQEPEWEQKIFNPPATEEDIAHFKEKVKSWGLPELPEIFYDFYRWHNGSKYENHGYHSFHNGESILSLSQVISNKEMWDELEQKDTFYQYERGTWWNTTWIPFLYIPDWWVGAIDTAGCFRGKAGQIICFDFKSAEPKIVRHASFEKWLETMLELKKHHALLYKVDEEGELLEETEEQEAVGKTIWQKLNDNDSFFVDIWKHRRKQTAENLHWQELEIAVKQGDLQTVQGLIEAGKIDLNEQNLYIKEKYTPLFLAIEYQAYPIIRWLIHQVAHSSGSKFNGKKLLWF